MKTVVVLFALAAAAFALPANLNWKYGEKPSNYNEALLRASLYGEMPMDTVVDCLQKDPDYATLVKLASKADLVSALSGAKAITVFAPTNAAFGMLPAAEVRMLENNPKLLAQVILGHATGSVVMAAQLMDNEQVPTLEANMAKIHISFSMDKKSVFADGAMITGPDACKAGNGVVHKVDRVIQHGNTTIVGEGIRTPIFSTLVAAVKAAGLVDALNNTDSALTLFAPTNEAFGKISSIVGCLIKPENKQNLVKVLTYHVAPKVYYARDLVSFSSIASLEGDMISVMVKGETVMVDKATVEMANVPALNGVIHVINEVILPNLEILGPCKP